MKKIFGRASDFYRIRLVHLEEVVPPELDWNSYVLFYPPPPYDSQTAFRYRLEVVDVDTGNSVPLAFFADESQADDVLTEVEEDIENLTKKEFEDKYKLFF